MNILLGSPHQKTKRGNDFAGALHMSSSLDSKIPPRWLHYLQRQCTSLLGITGSSRCHILNICFRISSLQSCCYVASNQNYSTSDFVNDVLKILMMSEAVLEIWVKVTEVILLSCLQTGQCLFGQSTDNESNDEAKRRLGSKICGLSFK